MASSPILGLIPTGYAPSSVVLDKKGNQLIVASDKGIGTTGIPPQNSLQTSHGVTAYGTHQDLGTVSIIPLPSVGELADWTNQVYLNNHWDLAQNIATAAGGNPGAKATVIPMALSPVTGERALFMPQTAKSRVAKWKSRRREGLPGQ